MITFYYVNEDNDEIKMKTGAITLDEVQDMFDRFLRAVGYVIPYDFDTQDTDNTVVTDERGITYGL